MKQSPLQDLRSASALDSDLVPKVRDPWESTAGPSPSAEIHLIPRQLFWRMTLASLGLILFSGLGQILYAYWPQWPGIGLLARLSDVDAERSFPTAYSALMLLVCAGLLGVIAAAPHLSGNAGGSADRRTHNPQNARDWRRLALIFLYLSLDELLGFHELAVDPLRDRFELTGAFYFAWVIPAAGLVGLFGLSFFRFWRRLPQKPRRLFWISALLFVGGALGIEMIGGVLISRWGETWIYLALQHLEEFLEIWGVAVFIYGLLSYICLRLDRPSLSLRL